MLAHMLSLQLEPHFLRRFSAILIQRSAAAASLDDPQETSHPTSAAYSRKAFSRCSPKTPDRSSFS
jgi:hypothetical protein